MRAVPNKELILANWFLRNHKTYDTIRAGIFSVEA